MLKKLLYILLLFSSVCFRSVQTRQSEVEEYSLKAAFLYNFSKYVDWPPSDAEEFVIGVCGSSSIVEPLREISKTKNVKGRNIVIRQFYAPDQMRGCNILFISKESEYPLSAILARVPSGTLTVAEKAGAAENGVAFNFVIIKNKLKFEANLSAISSAGLKASSDLLKLAIII